MFDWTSENEARVDKGVGKLREYPAGLASI